MRVRTLQHSTEACVIAHSSNKCNSIPTDRLGNVRLENVNRVPVHGNARSAGTGMLDAVTAAQAGVRSTPTAQPRG